MNEVIVYEGQEFEAGRCEICGVRIHPPDALADHISRHKAKTDRLNEYIDGLKDKMRRSRL